MFTLGEIHMAHEPLCRARCRFHQIQNAQYMLGVQWLQLQLHGTRYSAETNLLVSQFQRQRRRKV
jgi:hypothetical protein